MRRTDNLGPVRAVFDDVSPSILRQNVAAGEHEQIVTLTDRHRPLAGPIRSDARQCLPALRSNHATLRASLLLRGCRSAANHEREVFNAAVGSV